MGVFVWLIFCIGVGVFASNKGRSGFGWFFISILISPLIGGIIVACLKDLNVESNVQQVKMETQHVHDRLANDERLYEYRLNRVENDIGKIQQDLSGSPTIKGNTIQVLDEGTKECPYCGNTIKIKAVKCRFCGKMLSDTSTKECPYCKEQIPYDSVKCRYCSSVLQNEENANGGGL